MKFYVLAGDKTSEKFSGYSTTTTYQLNISEENKPLSSYLLMKFPMLTTIVLFILLLYVSVSIGEMIDFKDEGMGNTLIGLLFGLFVIMEIIFGAYVLIKALRIQGTSGGEKIFFVSVNIFQINYLLFL